MGANRDITKLHPELQEIIGKVVAECKKEGLPITITEGIRTVEYQNELYAKGRTAPGNIVTNAKGTSYSSMHQWGVAFDFCRNDGKGAYNESGNFFYKVGQIGKKYGLIWGGDWTSPVDKPHFQLATWGDTATQLKKLYGTPEKFKETWSKTTSSVPVKTTNQGTSSTKQSPAQPSTGNNGTKQSKTLQKGSKGNDVVTLQKNLKELGYDPKGADGVFGANTEKAVIAFQKANGLEPDGIVGPKTLAKIALLLKKKREKNKTNATKETYVVEGAVLTCSLGTKTSKLGVPLSHGSMINGKKQANIADCKSNSNIRSFGSCKRTSPPPSCSPFVILNWMKSKSKIKVGTKVALTSNCYACCLCGGIIKIKDDGQKKSTTTVTKKSNNQVSGTTKTTKQRKLEFGCKGEDVVALQTNLKALGFNPGVIDGDFGKNTKKAVIAFQKAYGLAVDGIVGPKTQAKIQQLLNSSSGTKKVPTTNKKQSTPVTSTPDKKTTKTGTAGFKDKHGDVIKKYADKLGIDEDILGAVILVESSGSGFVNGKLKIRFENHKFIDAVGTKYETYYSFCHEKNKRYKEHKFRTTPNGSWKNTHDSQTTEYEAFNFAKTLNETAAYESISMGLGQIMGFNYKAAGFSSAKEMFNNFSKSESNQIEGMIKFISNDNKMLSALQSGDLESFVCRYNGSSNVANYTKKLKNGIKEYKNAK